MRSNEEAILKIAEMTPADLLDGWGYLNDEQASRFIELVSDVPGIIPETTSEQTVLTRETFTRAMEALPSSYNNDPLRIYMPDGSSVNADDWSRGSLGPGILSIGFVDPETGQTGEFVEVGQVSFVEVERARGPIGLDVDSENQKNLETDTAISFVREIRHLTPLEKAKKRAKRVLKLAD